MLNCHSIRSTTWSQNPRIWRISPVPAEHLREVKVINLDFRMKMNGSDQRKKFWFKLMTIKNLPFHNWDMRSHSNPQWNTQYLPYVRNDCQRKKLYLGESLNCPFSIVQDSAPIACQPLRHPGCVHIEWSAARDISLCLLKSDAANLRPHAVDTNGVVPDAVDASHSRTICMVFR